MMIIESSLWLCTGLPKIQIIFLGACVQRTSSPSALTMLSASRASAISAPFSRGAFPIALLPSCIVHHCSCTRCASMCVLQHPEIWQSTASAGMRTRAPRRRHEAAACPAPHAANLPAHVLIKLTLCHVCTLAFEIIPTPRPSSLQDVSVSHYKPS